MSGIGMDAHNGAAGADPKARKDSVDDYNVYDDAKTYYQPERHKGTKASARTRTFSQVWTAQFHSSQCHVWNQCLRNVLYRTVF